MSVVAGAVYLTDMAAMCFIRSTTAAKSQSQPALSAAVRGLSCHVVARTERERREVVKCMGGGAAVSLEIEGVEIMRFFACFAYSL